MGDSDTRSSVTGREDVGLAEVFSLHARRPGLSGRRDERAFFFDTLAEYQWARDAAGLMPGTVDQLVKPVLEVCEHYSIVPWQLTPSAMDRYFAGPGKRARSTVRSKINKIDTYFAFLEQRYAGEIHRLFGTVVESPVDPFNRPLHRGDFGLRVPPSPRAMKEFFSGWRDALPSARKEAVACLEAQRLFGEPDYLLRVATTDLAAFQELYYQQLARLPGVQRLTSTLVMKNVIDDRPLPES